MEEEWESGRIVHAVRRGERGPMLAKLLADDGLRSLGPGTADIGFESPLRQLVPRKLDLGRPVVNASMGMPLVSALWLYHGFLNESHTLSQDIHTPLGSVLHGIMHRREGDFSNAKYWFRQAGTIEGFDKLARESHGFARGFEECSARSNFLKSEKWDPCRFVDLVQKSVDTGSADETFCLRLQWMEWWILFDVIYQRAIETS